MPYFALIVRTVQKNVTNPNLVGLVALEEKVTIVHGVSSRASSEYRTFKIKILYQLSFLFVELRTSKGLVNESE